MARRNIGELRKQIAADLPTKRCACFQTHVEITVVLPSAELTLEQEGAIKQIT